MGGYHETAHTMLMVASQGITLNTENMISVAAILVAVIIGIISCVVTWKAAVRSVSRMKLTYYKRVIEILSNSIHKQYNGLGDLKIIYGDELLDNPSLLLLEVENTGDISIANPPISIRVKENAQTRILSGIIQAMPEGYEEIWKICPRSSARYDIDIKYINKKQSLKAVFLLDHCSSEDEVSFICPMQDVTITQRITEEDFLNLLDSSLMGGGGASSVAAKFAVSLFRIFKELGK